jgi:hypothetical protein
VLAYVFWHRRAAGTGREDYEARLAAFHAALGDAVVASATFRIAAPPFATEEPGEAYEDWYLVADWAAIGGLEAAAVSGARKEPHDAAAALAAHGWAGVYGLLRGDAVPPAAARWEDKPRGESYDAYLARSGAPAIWRRRLVLGPAPELCVAEAAPGPAARTRVAGA